MRPVTPFLVLPFFAVALSIMLSEAQAQGTKAHELTFNKKGKVSFDGSLNADDLADAARKGHHYKLFTIDFKKGESYQIDMKSKSIDSFLRLEDSAGKQLAKDDDSGGDLNARILFACPKDGNYRIICTTWKKAELGKFHLSVERK